jgi:alkanesulfonate monooxygenase SsuD/methylene tetrahydromethanopterin reductase-like flavin-dependent oxidoreductase (luciferase family)
VAASRPNSEVVKFGISVPPFEQFFDARRLAALARDAEDAGWDGVFLWDHVLIWPTPIADPWVALACMALATERVKLGPLVTPLPRRRPVKLARECVTLDHLSRGRLVLGVGSGSGPWEFEYLGDEPDPARRAQMLEESVALLTRLWSGEPVLHDGAFYRFNGDMGPGNPEITPTPFLPRPVQSPRIPLWAAASWPKRAPVRRAAHLDGVVPLRLGADFGEYLTPEHTREIVECVQQHRETDAPFEVVISGHTDSAAERAQPEALAQAGATWWLEDISPWPFGWRFEGPWPVEAMTKRVRQGPPR